MKLRIASIILVILVTGMGFISFEHKKGQYGRELHELVSELNTINENQARIQDLKKKRADYFTKVFLLNWPGYLNSSVSCFLNVLIRMDNRKLSFTNISIKSRIGAFDFEIKGIFGKARNLVDLTDKLESSGGAFILSKTISGERKNIFVIKGEVSTE